MVYRINYEVLDEGNIPLRHVSMLSQNEGYFREFLQNRTRSNHPIIKKYLLNGRLGEYEEFLKILLLQILLNVDVEPIAD